MDGALWVHRSFTATRRKGWYALLRRWTRLFSLVRSFARHFRLRRTFIARHAWFPLLRLGHKDRVISKGPRLLLLQISGQFSRQANCCCWLQRRENSAKVSREGVAIITSCPRKRRQIPAVEEGGSQTVGAFSSEITDRRDGELEARAQERDDSIVFRLRHEQ